MWAGCEGVEGWSGPAQRGDGDREEGVGGLCGGWAFCWRNAALSGRQGQCIILRVQ